MNRVDLHSTRRHLGLSQSALATYLDATLEAVTAWETGTPIPAEVINTLHRLTRYTDGLVDGLASRTVATGKPVTADEIPDIWKPPLPDCWRRLVAARATSKATLT